MKMIIDSIDGAEKRLADFLDSDSRALSLGNLGMKDEHIALLFTPERIGKIIAHGIDKLDISCNNLETLPPCICVFKVLKILDISQNDFIPERKLPQSLACLTALELFYITHDHVRLLPDIMPNLNVRNFPFWRIFIYQRFAGLYLKHAALPPPRN